MNMTPHQHAQAAQSLREASRSGAFIAPLREAFPDMDAADAYALMSLAGDLLITQIVDGNKGVHAVLKRSLLPPVDDIAFAAGPLA